MKTQIFAGCVRRLVKSVFVAGLFGLVSAANFATATEVILVAKAPMAAPPGFASPAQELETINVLSKYDAGMRSELASVARYPNNPEARAKQLTGKVAIEFEIDHKGKLKEAEIVQTSNTRMLDAAALAAVWHAKYPPLPASALPVTAGRRYVATFDYRFASMD